MTDTKNRKKTGVIAAAVFLLVLALYLATMPQGVGWGDGADFVVSSYFLGVAHPTGYPLFTLLGKLFAWVPAGGPAFRVALISVVSGAAAAGVFFLLAARLSSLLIGLYAALVLAVSTFLWQQAVSIEVYTLNLLFCLCMVALAAPAGRAEKKRNLRDLLALVFVACVGLGNHGTLILPALALGVAGIIAVRRRFLPAAVGSAFLIVLWFTLYASLPLFSARADLFDWNMPTSVESLRVLISGLDFWVIGEYIPAVMWANTKVLAGSVLRQVWPPLVIGGVLLLFLKHKTTGSVKWVLLAVLAVSAFFPILYPTLEKEAFFLVATSMIVLMGAVGMNAFIEGGDRWSAAVLIVLLIANVPVVGAINYRTHNIRRVPEDDSAGDYSRQLLKSAPRDALLFIDHVADDTIAAPLYFQFMEGARRDAFIFHRLYLAFPWYRDYMRARASEIGDDIIIPRIDMEEEKNKNYRITLQEYNRLMEGKTLNTVSIDIQTRKIYDSNWRRRPVYINTPARFRKSVLADEVPLRVAGFAFAMDDSAADPPDAPPPALGGIFDAVMTDYYAERAYDCFARRDIRGFAAHLETALEYSDADWIYGELAGAYRELGDVAKAAQYEKKFTERKRVDDIYKP